MKKALSVGNILTAASAVELVTGLALIAVPDVVSRLLLGVGAAGLGPALCRFFGIALLALGLACWPDRPGAAGRAPAWRAMLAYNGLVAVYLLLLGTAGHFTGPLLWPAVAFHAVMALLLLWPPGRAPAAPGA
jgi:hypothetical protein